MYTPLDPDHRGAGPGFPQPKKPQKTAQARQSSAIWVVIGWSVLLLAAAAIYATETTPQDTTSEWPPAIEIR